MKRKSMVWIALLLVLLLMFLFTACGSNSGDNKANPSEGSSAQAVDATAKQTDKEPITITWLANISAKDITEGIQDNPVFNEIAKRTGVTWDFTPNVGVTDVNEKLGLLLASGDLPDMMTSGYTDTMNKIIKANYALPLDDLVNKYGPNMMKNCKEGLAVSKMLRSDESKNLYFIPSSTNGGAVNPIYPNAFYVRWDLYKKLGMPKLNTDDDFLKLLSDMQKLEPVTKDGKKTYAFGFGLTDYFSYTFVQQPAKAWSGLYNAQSDCDVYLPENKMVKRWDENSATFKQALLLNRAYRMGLVDPDSVSMNSQSLNEKYLAGRYLAYCGGGNSQYDSAFINAGTPEKGYVPVRVESYINNAANYQAETQQGGGWLSTCITKNCKYPERVIQMIDYLCTPEGAVLQRYGLEGQNWDIKDGQGVIRDDILNGMRNDPEYYKKVGISAFNSPWSSLEFMSPIGSKINGADAFFESNPATIQKQLTEVQKDYCKTMGYTVPIDLIKGLPHQTYDSWACNIMVLPDDLAKKENDLINFLDKNMPKLLIAKSDDEFAAAKKFLMDGTKKIGADECYESHLQQFTNAKTNLDAILKTMQ